MTRDILAYPKPVRLRDRNYVAFIRREPCCVSGTASHHHHVVPKGWGKMGSKVSDYRGVPLSPRLHNEYHRLGRERFEAKYNVDLDEVQIQCLEKYLSALKDGEDLGAK